MWECVLCILERDGGVEDAAGKEVINVGVKMGNGGRSLFVEVEAMGCKGAGGEKGLERF